ncbi:MAG TPA: aquaporin [Gemmataceae bacterium]|nr:aquaporin [Gemmataceae bacterium]
MTPPAPEGLTMDKVLRAYLAELVGTFLLVFLCAATVCAAQIEGGPPLGLVGIALAQGCVYAALLSATTLVSEGCLNPAVTLTLWVTKRFEGRQTLAMLAVQVIGAVAAGGLVCAVFNQQVLTDTYAGTPHLRALREAVGHPGRGVSVGDLLLGVLLEAAFTFLLTLAIFATIFDPRRPKLGGTVAGLALTGGVLIGYNLTGAALNPARWFGTAVWQRTLPQLAEQPVFADHPVYWMGPIVGALLAGIVYTGVIHPPPPAERESGTG